jgi:hypothetical protein
MKNTDRIPPIVFLCALFVFLFCSSFSYFILDHTPRIQDEIAYNFQAKIFLSGRLYAPSPTPAGSFDFPHIVNNGRWYAQYPPGFPLLMVLGLLIHAPWLINPILAGLSIFLFYFLGREMYGRRIGILAAVLGSLSIWLLVLSSSMMSHTGSMFCMTLFLLFLFKSLNRPTPANGIAAGASLGMLLLVRPLDAVLLSIPFLLFYGINSLRAFKERSRNLLGFGLAMGTFVGILFAYNTLTNGHPLKMGYMVYLGEGKGLGFGSMVYEFYEHTAFLGFQNIAKNLAEYSKYLFGWPLTSFFAILALLLIRKRDGTHTLKDLLLASSFMCQVTALVFYWGAFTLLGPRLFFSTFPLMLLLSARGIHELERWLETRQQLVTPRWAKTALYALLFVFTLYAFGVTLPRWIKAPGSDWFYERVDHHFAGVNPDIHNSIKSALPEGSLVIFKFIYHPLLNFAPGWWGSGFQHNGPDLREEIIYAMDVGEENIKLFESFPERKIFMYLGLIDKGMLFPLKTEGKGLAVDPSFFTRSEQAGHITLFDDPLQYYTMYSPAFRETISQLYTEYSLWEVDVTLLQEKGKEAYANQDYEHAVHYIEAALQLELEPFFRYHLLNLLGVYYLRAGDTASAKTVQACLVEKNMIHMYNILPERGF